MVGPSYNESDKATEMVPRLADVHGSDVIPGSGEGIRKYRHLVEFDYAMAVWRIELHDHHRDIGVPTLHSTGNHSICLPSRSIIHPFLKVFYESFQSPLGGASLAGGVIKAVPSFRYVCEGIPRSV